MKKILIYILIFINILFFCYVYIMCKTINKSLQNIPPSVNNNTLIPVSFADYYKNTYLGMERIKAIEKYLNIKFEESETIEYPAKYILK